MVQHDFPLSAAEAALQLYEEHVAIHLDRAWLCAREATALSSGGALEQPAFYFIAPPQEWGYRLQWVYANNSKVLALFHSNNALTQLRRTDLRNNARTV